MRWLPPRVFLHDIALLVCRRPQAAALPLPGLRTDELGAHQADQILSVHARVGHRMSQRRIDQRFANGLRFFTLHAGDALLGSSWAAVGSARYVDELNWLLPIAPGEFWLRDVFIPPQHRGQGLLPAFVRLLAEQRVEDCTAAWSDVDWANAQSMRAHAKAGFDVVARARCLDIAGRLRLRSALPTWHLPVLELKLQDRILLLRGTNLLRHQQLLA